MDDRVELIGMVENPSARRMWLLANALRSLPFDRAIDLARSAEAFVTGVPLGTQSEETHVNANLGAAQDRESPGTADPEYRTTTDIRSSTPQPIEQMGQSRNPVLIPDVDRDRLLDRLASGAKNAELAAEFGMSSKRVQGIRMGCSREIARRREQFGSKTASLDQIGVPTAAIEEVVRYLRQQDDVVVAQENGEFLVNGRFKMRLAELVSRANRMRARQGKPAFELPGGTPVPRGQISSANSHPVFWEEPAAAQRGRNGLHQPKETESC